MKRRVAPAWRRRFLWGLKTTGNVRVAARRAGIDHGTAYGHRKRDPRFAAQWARERARAGEERSSAPSARSRNPLHHAAHGSPPRPGEELVLRRSKTHGAQMVRAASGRWSASARERFLTTLAATGCVRRAAAACGLSTTALYNRRKNCPDLAADWAAAEAHATAALRGFVVAAGIATFDPEAETEGAETPKVTVSEAIAILRLKSPGPAAGRAAARAAANDADEPPIEQVRDEVLRQVAAIRRKRQGGGQ